MKHINSLLLVLTLLLSFQIGSAQIVTSSPSFPTADDAVTITFDATLGTGGLAGYTGDVYAHTGVITNNSSSNTDWKYAPTWGDNSSKYQLTSVGNDRWQLQISSSIREYYGVPANEQILQLAFVFRSADNSKEGKDDGNTDIFLSVSQGDLNVRFDSPSNNSIFEVGSSSNITINASGNDQLQLFINGSEDSNTSSTSISKTLTNSTAGDYQLIAVATAGSEVARDTVNFVVRNPNTTETRPSGLNNGVNYNSNTSASLQLYAPHKNHIFVIGDFNDWTLSNQYQMKKDGDYFWLTIDNLNDGEEYAYQYIIDGSIKIADPYAEKVLDPWNDQYIPESVYPNLKEYPSGKTSEIVSVLQTGQTAFSWSDENFSIPAKEDLVIYELLIRDFTENRDIKTVTDTLDYLQNLGVNAIELMPFNEFEGNDSWGYNPSFYFATDKAYGTKNDYKTFINECHRRGIAVFMDMVLNHSFGQSPFVKMYFDGNNPSAQNPWYNESHNFENTDAHWGYDFDHTAQATQDLVDAINSYWMNEYHIDGFRFDFTKGFSNKNHPNSGSDVWGSDYDSERINILKRMSTEIWNVKSDAIVIFEHLSENSEETELANHGILLWGNANHNYNEATMGYHDSNKSDLTWTSWRERGWNQANVVNYMESHDEERLMYKNLEYGNSNGDYDVTNLSTALSRIQTAAAFFFTIPGPKMIWQFGELGYDISIDQNGRVGKKPILWEYFEDADRLRLYQTFAALTKLKKEEVAFRSNDFTLVTTDALKRIEINHSDMDVRVIGNFDVVSGTISANFSRTGTWYDYISGETINVTDLNATHTLEAGEFHIYTSKQLETPTFPAPPVASDLTISGTLQLDQEISANYSYSDANNDSESGTTIQWYVAESKYGRNEQAIDGAIYSNYTITSNDVGKYLRFAVTPRNAAAEFANGKTIYSPYSEEIQGITGIDDVLKKELRIYPNPVRDLLHIENLKDVKSIQIYNLTGKIILNLSQINPNMDIHLSHLSKGIYIIVFQAEDNTQISRKIIKQ